MPGRKHTNCNPILSFMFLFTCNPMSSHAEVAFYNSHVWTYMFYHHLGCQVASVLSFFPFVQSEFTVKVKHRSKAPQVSFLAFWKGELILSASPWSCAEVHLPTYMHTAHEWILRGTTARRCLPLTTAGLCPPSSMC